MNDEVPKKSYHDANNQGYSEHGYKINEISLDVHFSASLRIGRGCEVPGSGARNLTRRTCQAGRRFVARQVSDHCSWHVSFHDRAEKYEPERNPRRVSLPEPRRFVATCSESGPRSQHLRAD